MKSIKWVSGLIGLAMVALLLTGGVVLAQTGNGYDLTWWTVDGGGDTLNNGGYSLTGTVGQPDAGPVLAGGEFKLTGGFWSAASSTGGSGGGNSVYLPIILRNQ